VQQFAALSTYKLMAMDACMASIKCQAITPLTSQASVSPASRDSRQVSLFARYLVKFSGRGRWSVWTSFRGEGEGPMHHGACSST